MRILLVLVILTFAVPALAQDSAEQKATPQKPRSTDAQAEKRQTDTTPQGSVNADQLGVSLDRIRLKFQRSALFEPVFDPDKLRLSTRVDVVGKAPPLRLFGPDANVKNELTSRAVPFGAPTHRDMLQVMTPQEFRTPAMDMMALFQWLSKQLDKDAKEE